MIEGPGLLSTTRRTGRPTAVLPRIRCALMRRSEPATDGRRETQRILLLRSFSAGARSGSPKTSAAIRPDRPTTYGITGSLSLKPLRAQTGSTPTVTSPTHGADVARTAAA